MNRAIIAYESTLRLRPRCAEAWNNMGVLHREQHNVERAVECYLRAVAITPTFAQALNNLGVVYTAQGQAGGSFRTGTRHSADIESPPPPPPRVCMSIHPDECESCGHV